MSRVFAYARVSTTTQFCSNQKNEIAAAGYEIPDHRFIEEEVSGSVCAFQRKGFKSLIEKLESGDTLVVSKLDRLGRDSIDVQKTVEYFTQHGIRLKVLNLGDVDVTSSTGALMVKVFAAFAAFERDLIIERVQAGLARAKSEGKTLGRKTKTTAEQRKAICQRRAQAVSVSQLARDYSISRATVLSIVAANNAA
jgi:putative DNA-invertase from lambdoid prophage Rac